MLREYLIGTPSSHIIQKRITMDQLVEIFRTETNERKRSKIFIEIRSIYYPKIISIAATYPRKYSEELISIYDYQVLLHINRWTGKNKKGEYCSFKSFLYWAVKKAESSLNEKIISRDRRYDRLDRMIDTANQHMISLLDDEIDGELDLNFEYNEPECPENE